MNKAQIRTVSAAASKSNQTTVARFHKTRTLSSKQLAITKKLSYLK